MYRKHGYRVDRDSLEEKFDMYSCDSQLVPLFVQNNYLRTRKLLFSLSLSLSHSLSLSISLSLSHSLYISLSLTFSLTLFLSLYLFLSPSISLSFSLSLYISLSLSITHSLSLSLTLAPYISHSLSYSLSFILSLSISLSHSFSLPVHTYSYSVILVNVFDYPVCVCVHYYLLSFVTTSQSQLISSIINTYIIYSFKNSHILNTINTYFKLIVYTSHHITYILFTS